MRFKCVLALAPHTDDVELGCGGTLAQLVAEGSRVIVHAFSTCEESLPKEVPSNTLELEFNAAMKTLGINEFAVSEFPVRRLDEHRQGLLEQLREDNEIYNPDLVLMPAASDLHQDHQVLHQEAIRCFKHTSCWGYELPWNNISFTASGFNSITADNLAKKCEAIAEYKTQAQRGYTSVVATNSLAITRGVQADTAFAEAFEVYRHYL